MKKSIIYHNPQCSKSRETLSLLKENSCDFEVQEYLKENLTKDEITEILSLLNMEAIDLVRKTEEAYKTIVSERNKSDISNSEWIEYMVKFPKLIERPIVIHNNKAVIGRPPQKVLEIF